MYQPNPEVFLPREQEVLAEDFARQLGRVVFVEDMFPPDFDGVRELRRPWPSLPSDEIFRELVGVVA
ncbi:MAG: hypothetical protein QG629_759 [Patescibacteria group bacterium]|nr:hypothetical protein [Candidatus Saccharibacteria bacterium]MDQ5963676.1 hypothetical protein [Patescibacteria group bacterium]